MKASCYMLVLGALILGGCVHLPQQAAPIGHSWPLAGPTPRVLSNFGEKRGGEAHRGIDLGVPKGAPVLAAFDGTVAYSGRMRGYGRCVFLAHDNGLETRYAHLRKRKARAGETVQQGTVIGFSGASGNATAPHLHFETRLNGKAVDPRSVLSGR